MGELLCRAIWTRFERLRSLKDFLLEEYD